MVEPTTPDTHVLSTDRSRESPSLPARMQREGFPRSAAYSARWQLENMMGPNSLWLTEALTAQMGLMPGMRVLDLGCGRGVSSIFLAREFGVQVWATDLWVKASDNWRRFDAERLGERIFPIHAEAHALPFAHGFFDAVTSIDAYHYFGTDDLYLETLARLVKPRGQIGIVVPGLTHEFTDGVPAHLVPFWEREYWSFHSPEWWRRHFERTGPVTVETATLIPDGGDIWREWPRICRDEGYRWFPAELAMLEADAASPEGPALGLVSMISRVEEI